MSATTHDRDDSRRGMLDVEELVRDFENCTLPLNSFKHHAHLIVISFYLTRMSPPEATERFRTYLYQFINHHGVTGYNETITLFWIGLVHQFLKGDGADRSFKDLIGELIERYGDSGLIFNYYSRELLSSEKAKADWLEPDLKPLDF